MYCAILWAVHRSVFGLAYHYSRKGQHHLPRNPKWEVQTHNGHFARLFRTLARTDLLAGC
jgi:hypothetical protein